MDVLIHDPAVVQQLRQAQTALILTDSAGAALGRFVPGDDPIAAEPPITEEELQRLEQEEGGRRLADILADLSAR